jgi:DNA-binding transcriptional LysR family regulator
MTDGHAGAPVITFKQLEAMYWVVKLGSFASAAHKLHATQSAVSKRVQELESLVDTPLFDRTLRTARLTDKGQEMYLMAQRLLDERERLMQQFLKPEVQEQRVRIGVTEVTAMTWLPRFVDQINQCYPKVIIDPEVDSGALLRDKLLADEIDLMIAADSFRDARFNVIPVGTLHLEWMCRPGLVKHGSQPLRVQALQEYRILTQGPQSGTGIMFQDWFKEHGLKTTDLVVSNSLLALIGLTVSGFGVSYLPPASVRPMVQGGLLEVLRVRPVLPEAPYVAITKRDRRSSLIASIVTLAQQTCDFTRLFQALPHGESLA